VKTYTTHQGLATCLRFALGDAAHLRTYRRRDGRINFEFADPEGKTDEIAKLFFSGELATGDARALLECDRAVRTTVRAALESNGQWRNEQ